MDMTQAKKLMKLQQDAMRIKKELSNTFIESEIDGLVITFNGEMKAEKVEFEDTTLISGLDKGSQTKLETAILESINKWVKKSQEVAAEQMKGVMWEMGLGGGMPGM